MTHLIIIKRTWSKSQPVKKAPDVDTALRRPVCCIVLQYVAAWRSMLQSIYVVMGLSVYKGKYVRKGVWGAWLIHIDLCMCVQVCIFVWVCMYILACAGHDQFIEIYACGMTHLWLRLIDNSLIMQRPVYVIRLLGDIWPHTYDSFYMTHSHVRHDSQMTFWYVT